MEKFRGPLLLYWLAFGTHVAAGSLHCTFSDEKGRALEKVETRLERLVPEKESEGQVSHKESDAKGRVKCTHLEPGTYLFQAQAENYVPVTTRIDVQGQRQIERVLLKQDRSRTGGLS